VSVATWIVEIILPNNFVSPHVLGSYVMGFQSHKSLINSYKPS